MSVIQIQYKRDDLDAAIKKQEPTLASNSSFSALRDSAYSIVMGEYNQERIADPDDFILVDNYSAPLATGAALLDTTLYDVFRAALPADCVAIFGDTILVKQGTGVFEQASRAAIADLILSGTGQTKLAFATHDGKVDLYTKDGEFTAPGLMAFVYFRKLDNTLPDANTTPLDIRAQDFSDIVSRVSALML